MDWSLTPAISRDTLKRRKVEIHQSWVLLTGHKQRWREKEVSGSGKNVTKVMAPGV